MRLLQSLWRQDNHLTFQLDGQKILGSRLGEVTAEQNLRNFLTKTIRDVVRCEVLDQRRSQGKLYQPQMFDNLLSSQALAFNLFGELRFDCQLASQALEGITCGPSRIEQFEFEWSPGRSDPKYLSDKTAFDVYIRYRTDDERKGFLGIEVKYHEDLGSSNLADHRERYDEVADQMGCFRSDALPRLQQSKKLNQMWRDHMLVGIHQNKGDFDEAYYVFLYPEANESCTEAVGEYRDCLSDPTSFVPLTINSFVATLMYHSNEEWIRQFYGRYLDLGRVYSP